MYRLLCQCVLIPLTQKYILLALQLTTSVYNTANTHMYTFLIDTRLSLQSKGEMRKNHRLVSHLFYSTVFRQCPFFEIF